MSSQFALTVCPTSSTLCAPIPSHGVMDFGAALDGILDKRQDLRVVAVRHHVAQVTLRRTWQVAGCLLC